MNWEPNLDELPLIDQGKPVTQQEAIELCLKVEAVIAPLGAHCGLTGSCLYKGQSGKDVDIIIYSHQAIIDPYNKEILLDALVKSGLLAQEKDGSYFFQTTANYLDKDVVICTVDGFRVDFFFFS